CLRDTLTLPLAEAQRLIPPARPAAARVLGSEVGTQQAEDKPCRAPHRRCINGALGWKRPVEVLRTQGAHAMRHGNPTHWAARLPATEYRRVTPYPAAIGACGSPPCWPRTSIGCGRGTGCCPCPRRSRAGGTM